jgi:hypothetical protein
VWEKRVEETTGRVKKRTEDRESQGDKGEEKEVRDRGRHKGKDRGRHGVGRRQKRRHR